MIFLLLFPILFYSHNILAQQKEYEQCGGENYNGPTNCANGLQCYRQHKWYSQCHKSCPSDWDCSKDDSKTTTREVVTVNPPIDTGNFPGCQFRFGRGFVGPNIDYSGVDYISIWAGAISDTHGTNFNPWWHGDMLNTAMRLKKLPVYYAYIIAFMARQQWGLKDCDVGEPSLCQRGSEFIRNQRSAIIAKYKHYASETAKIIGRNGNIIWLIEPDFWQYYGDTKQQNGAISGPEMRKLFDDIALAIKSELPKAQLSWDISAWLSESAMRTWWSYFASSPYISFIHTSGGQSRANSANIKPNELRWSFMSSLTRKKIIADTGYGVAGGSTGHNYDYDNHKNLEDRIKDGVIAVAQANPRNDWKVTMEQLRKSLPRFC